MSASDVESSGLPRAGTAPAQQSRRLGSRTPVTFTLIGACVLLWGLGLWWGSGSDSVLWYLGANNGRAVRDGQVYRLLSCLLLHLGWVHLLLNMIALRALSTLELLLGKSRFLLLFSLSGLGASVSTAWLRPDVLSVGASGAIWGLMGAAFGMRIPTRHVLRARGVRLSSGWQALALNLAISFLPGVDLTAHLGGGLVGFVLGATSFYPDYAEPGARPRRRVPFWVERAGATVAALALAGALAAALAAGRPWRLAEPPVLRRVELTGKALSLELPELIAAEPLPVTLQELSSWRFGAPGRSPLSVKLQLLTTSPQIPEVGLDMTPEEQGRWLAQLRDQIEREPSPDLQRVALELTLLGERRFLRDEYRGSELRVVRFFGFVGPFPMQLEMMRWGAPPNELSPGFNEVWPGVEERIAASLRYDPRRAPR